MNGKNVLFNKVFYVEKEEGRRKRNEIGERYGSSILRGGCTGLRIVGEI